MKMNDEKTEVTTGAANFGAVDWDAIDPGWPLHPACAAWPRMSNEALCELAADKAADKARARTAAQSGKGKRAPPSAPIDAKSCAEWIRKHCQGHGWHSVRGTADRVPIALSTFKQALLLLSSEIKFTEQGDKFRFLHPDERKKAETAPASEPAESAAEPAPAPEVETASSALEDASVAVTAEEVAALRDEHAKAIDRLRDEQAKAIVQLNLEHLEEIKLLDGRIEELESASRTKSADSVDSEFAESSDAWRQLIAGAETGDEASDMLTAVVSQAYLAASDRYQEIAPNHGAEIALYRERAGEWLQRNPAHTDKGKELFNGIAVRLGLDLSKPKKGRPWGSRNKPKLTVVHNDDDGGDE
jgi:hypothetical protein